MRTSRRRETPPPTRGAAEGGGEGSNAGATRDWAAVGRCWEAALEAAVEEHRTKLLLQVLPWLLQLLRMLLVQ